MWQTLASSLEINQLWFAVPLVVAVSLVYGATRHEEMLEILRNAYHAAKWITGFMATIFVVLFVLSWLV